MPEFIILNRPCSHLLPETWQKAETNQGKCGTTQGLGLIWIPLMSARKGGTAVWYQTFETKRVGLQSSFKYLIKTIQSKLQAIL